MLLSPNLSRWGVSQGTRKVKITKYLKKPCLKKAMERLNADGTVIDLVARLRRERDLIEQIKSDCSEVNRTRENARSGRENGAGLEDLNKLLSWLEKGARSLGELEGSDIENITWARNGIVENEIRLFGLQHNLPPIDRKLLR